MTPDEEDVSVSTLELFFDLVFVFTITQLTAVLAHEMSVKGALQVVLMLGVIWYAVRTDRAERRALLLGGMGAYLILALAIPHAFADGGPAFGIAYFIVVLVHTSLFARTTKGVELTRAGDVLRAGAARVIGAAEDAVRDTRRAAIGREGRCVLHLAFRSPP